MTQRLLNYKAWQTFRGIHLVCGNNPEPIFSKPYTSTRVLYCHTTTHFLPRETSELIDLKPEVIVSD